MKNFLYLSILIFLNFPTHKTLSQEITIQRIHSTDYSFAGCTLGYLSVNGEVICYTLELPFRGNATNISSIPAGSYEAFIRTDGNKGWRLELYHVPSRYNIQIHIGNYTGDIKGCTLLGMNVSLEYCEIYKSKTAINLLREKINPLLDEYIIVNFFD